MSTQYMLLNAVKKDIEQLNNNKALYKTLSLAISQAKKLDLYKIERELKEIKASLNCDDTVMLDNAVKNMETLLNEYDNLTRLNKLSTKTE